MVDGPRPMEFKMNPGGLIKRKQLQQKEEKLGRGWRRIWEEIQEGIGDKYDQNHCICVKFSKN